MSRKKLIAVMTAFSLVAGSIVTPPVSSYAASTLKLKNVTNGTKTIYVGKKFTVKTNLSTKKLTFQSSNKKVATVSAKGVVKAKTIGSCKITVIGKLSKKKTAKKTFKLKVKKQTSSATPTAAVTASTSTPIIVYTPPADGTATVAPTQTNPVTTSELPAQTTSASPVTTQAPGNIQTGDNGTTLPTETVTPISSPDQTATTATKGPTGTNVPAASTTAPVTPTNPASTASPQADATTTPLPTKTPEVTGTTFVSSITFSEKEVTLADENGNTIEAGDASNLYVTDGTYVTIVAPTNDNKNSDNNREITISGTCSNGQISVSVDKTTYADGEVDISLAGLTLSNPNNSPIYVDSIDGSCNISVKNKTTNILSDGESYTNPDEDNGVIYSKDDLKIKGKGTLTITGNCGYGIISKDDLKVYNGTIQITSKDVCLKGKDSVKIGDKDDFGTEGAYENLNLTLNSTGSDCVRSNNPMDDSTLASEDDDYADGKEGTIIIYGGTIKATAYADAFQSNGTLTVNGGTFDIYTYEGSQYSSHTNNDPANGWVSMPGNGGMWGRPGSSRPTTEPTTTTSTEVSAKGFKSEGDMTINGGTATFDTSDDSFHCGGNLTVNGGTFTIATGDDGIHSDNTLSITDGTIQITNSYEGIEGTNIQIYGGVIDVVSSDDGINAAGGNSASSWNSFFPSTTSSSYSILISGGYVHVNANGDGLDSNGTITVSGGTTLIEGPSNSGNSSIDSDGQFNFEGGVIFALDAGGMRGEGVPSNTTNYLTATIDATYLSSNTIAIADASGNVASIFQCMKTAKRVIYMNGDITASEYTATLNPTYDGSLDNFGYGTGGTISGGTALANESSSSGGFPTSGRR